MLNTGSCTSCIACLSSCSTFRSVMQIFSWPIDWEAWHTHSRVANKAELQIGLWLYSGGVLFYNFLWPLMCFHLLLSFCMDLYWFCVDSNGSFGSVLIYTHFYMFLFSLGVFMRLVWTLRMPAALRPKRFPWKSSWSAVFEESVEIIFPPSMVFISETINLSDWASLCSEFNDNSIQHGLGWSQAPMGWLK